MLFLKVSKIPIINIFRFNHNAVKVRQSSTKYSLTSIMRMYSFLITFCSNSWRIYKKALSPSRFNNSWKKYSLSFETECAKIFTRYWTHFHFYFHFEFCWFRFHKRPAGIKPIPEFWSLIILKMWSFVWVFPCFWTHWHSKKKCYMIFHRIW